MNSPRPSPTEIWASHESEQLNSAIGSFYACIDPPKVFWAGCGVRSRYESNEDWQANSGIAAVGWSIGFLVLSKQGVSPKIRLGT